MRQLGCGAKGMGVGQAAGVRAGGGGKESVEGVAG